jgi:aspartyl-tRNA(Asn)/glutamyl-tRNA(Gln) amidotransferase subunit A
VAVRRAREAGAILIGKTSTHEFAWGVTCDNPHYGACRNPWDHGRVSGGSSGGSAVALAAGAAPLALGSDTGGSIRIPAAFCGVVGLKPTYGGVSAAGVFPLARSLDHVGPMARRPRDAGLLYRVLAGIDRSSGPGDLLEGGQGPSRPSVAGLDGVRVGICPDLHGVELAEDVERVLVDAITTTRQLGGTIVELEFPDKDLIGRTFTTIQRAEALETHRRRGLFPQRSSEYGEDVRERLELAMELGLPDYLGAAVDRARVAAGLSRIFGDVELLLTPVSAGSAARVGEATCLHRGREVDFRTLVMGTTMPYNLAGLPACTVRGGFDSGGRPVGLQFVGSQWSEARTLAAAESFFEATPAIQDRWPDLSS